MRVVRLGAVLELQPHNPLSSPGFAVREFADLDGGRRVWWREDRGWSGSLSDDRSEWPVQSGRDMVAEVLEITGGHERVDDYVTCALWALRATEPEIDAASLWAAPYVVEFGPLLSAELERVASCFDPPPAPPRPDFPLVPGPDGDRAAAAPPDWWDVP